MEYIITEELLEKAGNLENAALLAVLKTMTNEKNKWFLVRTKDLLRMTYLSEFKQKKILSQLSHRGLISVAVKGMPATRNIMIH